MIIYFSCKKCGLTNAKAKVESRASAEVSVTKWVEEELLPSVQLHHRILSPMCDAKKVDLKIPVGDDDFIGQDKRPS